MLSDSEDDDEHFQRSRSGDLHNALHLAVGKICCREDMAAKELASTSTSTTAAQAPHTETSKDAIEALTQMTFHYATKCLAKDLVAFCKHANRKTITVDDVKLVARKNPRGLLESLEGFCDISTLNVKEKKRNNFMEGSNVNLGMGTNNASPNISRGAVAAAATRRGLGRGGETVDADSSSDDGLGALSNIIGGRKRKQSSDSSSRGPDLGIDLQIGSSSSSSSSSDSDGSSKKIKRSLPKQKQISSIQDSSSSDDGIRLPLPKNVERKNQINASAPIELNDSDSD
mmetsp:Transcript_507/g.764  ORF Transcript_507/g.764 Transcript_507/m.764 type:complete len:286 (-) Transcript_507:597-1454(-)